MTFCVQLHPSTSLGAVVAASSQPQKVDNSPFITYSRLRRSSQLSCTTSRLSGVGDGVPGIPCSFEAANPTQLTGCYCRRDAYRQIHLRIKSVTVSESSGDPRRL